MNPSATRRDRLRAAVLDLIEQHRERDTIPTSARFLFYELEHLGAISKVRTGARRPDQDLIDVLTELRKSSKVGWDEITDETRTLTSWQVAPTVAGM